MILSVMLSISTKDRGKTVIRKKTTTMGFPSSRHGTLRFRYRPCRLWILARTGRVSRDRVGCADRLICAGVLIGGTRICSMSWRLTSCDVSRHIINHECSYFNFYNLF
uniref:Uncharacterized protein n=1 Tax=Davidia involucrata TaxID=16924 RepID=A0A5B6Z6G6_DAVIN